MALIRIQEDSEQTGTFHTKVVFDQGPAHDIIVRDPFSKEEEERIEWYFEKHLEFPFTDQVKAHEAAASITRYGEMLFFQVFSSEPQIHLAYEMATQGGLEEVRIEIIGRPSFQALHWEALKDPESLVPLALQAMVVRKNGVPLQLPATIAPSPTINLLIVTARPRGKRDVGYRTISRPLVETLHQAHVKVQVDILRPGTYDALENQLREITSKHGPGYYHVIHFDVHGSLLTYEEFRIMSRFMHNQHNVHQDIKPYDGLKAFLALEGEQEDLADLVEAGDLAALLVKHQIPIAILNACQSGKQIGEQETSLGSHLSQAGVPIVVAMGYSVTVSAAELFMRTIYQQLFTKDDLAAGIRAGRAALNKHKARRAYFGQQIDLEDWMLPVIYQNQLQHLDLREFTAEELNSYHRRQGQRYIPPQPGYGFVGRDLDILQIEKRLLTRRNILLVEGMGGVGKTTLLQHLGNWWQTTGFVDQVCYFGYDERVWTHQQLLVGTAEQVLGKEQLSAFQPLSLNAQEALLTQHLRTQRYLLILDNLESITGTKSAQYTWPPDEQAALRRFLASLAGGYTLVLLGSRGNEAWLAKETFDENIYYLEGLDSEAASLLADRILERQGVTKYRENEDLQKLLQLLNGFPLALEVILANLTRQTPIEALTALQAGDIALDTSDSQKKTESILRCIDHSYSNLTPDAQMLLLCLAPFTSEMFLGYTKDYTTYLRQQPALASLPFERWLEVLQEAENWGLLKANPKANLFLRLHPTLTFFLRNRLQALEKAEFRQAIETAFLEYFNRVSEIIYEYLTSNDPRDKRVGIGTIHAEYHNLMTCLDLELKTHASIFSPYMALTEYLDSIIENQRSSLKFSQTVLGRLKVHWVKERTDLLNSDLVMVLETIAQQQLALKQHQEARASCQEALSILDENKGMKPDEITSWKASIQFVLGKIATDQRLWAEAEQHYQLALQASLDIDTHTRSDHIYYQLGMVAQEQYQWAEAEQYYQQALQIYTASDDRHSQTEAYYQLSIVTSRQSQWVRAEQYCLKALRILANFVDRHLEALIYHQLGNIAQEQGQWGRAEHYYLLALRMNILIDDRYGQAHTYLKLGVIASVQEQWTQAEQYCQLGLQIFTDFGDRYFQAQTYQEMCIIARGQGQLTQAEECAQQALQIFTDLGDQHEAARVYDNLGNLAQDQHQWTQAEQYYQRALQIYEDYKDRYSQAGTYNNLGTIVEQLHQWDQAEQYYQIALRIFLDFDDLYGLAGAYYNLGHVAEQQGQPTTASRYFLQALESVADEKNTRTYHVILRGLARLWQDTNGTELPTAVASILHMSSDEAKELLLIVKES